MKLLLFLTFAPFLMLADDLITKDGKTFKNYSVAGVTIAGLSIMHDEGVYLVAWDNLTPEQMEPYTQTLERLKKRAAARKAAQEAAARKKAQEATTQKKNPQPVKRTVILNNKQKIVLAKNEIANNMGGGGKTVLPLDVPVDEYKKFNSATREIQRGHLVDSSITIKEVLPKIPGGAICEVVTRAGMSWKEPEEILVVDIPEEYLIENKSLPYNEKCTKHPVFHRWKNNMQRSNSWGWMCALCHAEDRSEKREFCRLYSISEYIYTTNRGTKASRPRYTYSRKAALKELSFPNLLKYLE